MLCVEEQDQYLSNVLKNDYHRNVLTVNKHTVIFYHQLQGRAEKFKIDFCSANVHEEK